MHNSTTILRYHQAVRFIESMQSLPGSEYMQTRKRRGSNYREYFLERAGIFLRRLGNPQRGQRYIHIGGSSGKGSVATMVHEILQAAGYRSGLYLSPYTTTNVERFRIGDLLMRPEEFVAIVEEIKPEIDWCYEHSPYGRPSYFEICTAIAFLYFKRHQCDYVVLEVGMGGRYDATNLIATPAATVINTISLDHTHILGSTLKEIAREKAGIIKNGGKVVIGPQHPSITRYFHDQCKKIGAEFSQALADGAPFDLQVPGQHQQNNAAIASAVADILHIDDHAVRVGLKRAWLPCRFEIMQKNPRVILDGAHNPAKIESVANTLTELTYKKLYLIIALTRERRPRELFPSLLPLANEIWCTRYLLGGRSALPPLQLRNELKRLRPKTKLRVALDPHQALAEAIRKAKSSDLVLATGSLYLCGELRTHWRPEVKILEQRHS